MSAEMSAALAGLALIAVELIRSVPALRRVQRTGTSDGVSGTSLGVLAGTGLGWLVLAVMVAFFGVVSIASNGVRFVRVAYRRLKRLDLGPPEAAPVAAARP